MVKTTIRLRLMSLAGKLCTISEQDVDASEAMAIVKKHANSAGYTDVKLITEDDGYSVRFTATTPGGRRGRNVAFGDY